MKNIFIFLLGFVFGIAATLAYLGESVTGSSNYSLFEKPKECVVKKPLRVFQVISPSEALAIEQTDLGAYNGKVFLITNNKNNAYYDDQIIRPDKNFKYIGIFRYHTKDDFWKTVPIIEEK
ncbi:MAG: hypothetical protein K6B46_05380 [Opitutales bacterium]|nr:hypothetical protein [Opitutales bacterium]